MLCGSDGELEADALGDSDSLGDVDKLGEGVVLGVVDSDGDGDTDSDGDGDVCDGDGVPAAVLSSLGLLAAEADPVPAPTVGSGRPGVVTLPFPEVANVPEVDPLPTALAVAREPATDTATVRFCCCVARRAAAACSGVTLAGSTTSSAALSDSLELSDPAVTAPRIDVFTTVATAPAARTPDSDSTVTTRTRFIASSRPDAADLDLLCLTLLRCCFGDSQISSRKKPIPTCNGNPKPTQKVRVDVQESANSGGAHVTLEGQTRLT